MEKIKGLAIDLDLDHLSVDRGLKGLKDNIRTINSEMRRNMSAFDYADRSVNKYQTRIDGLNRKLEVQKRVVEEARKEYEEMVKEHGAGSKEAEKAAREYNNQAAALNNLERYIERTKNELIELEKQQRIANSTFTKIGERLESYGGKLKNVGSHLDNLGGRMTRSITLPVVGATTAIGGMVAAFGWGRLKSLDTAQAQLKGFGYTAKEVEVISEDVREAVTGTTLTMAEGTSIAAGGLAAGVKQGKELEKYIRRVGNAAAGANRPAEEMAMIFNRIQGSGRVMTQELNQIEHAMPGFSRALSKHLGVSIEKLREMVTAGEVTSKDFMKVMDNFAGDMAKEYAKTWDGMVANTKANIGIIGESFLRGVFQDSKKSLAEFLDMLRSPDIRRRAEEMGRVAQREFNRMKEAIAGVVEWYKDLDDNQKELIKRLGLLVVAGGPVLQLTGRLTSGLGSVFEMTGKVSKAIGVARGAGLAAGLASLGPAGIAGVAVAGLTAVGGAAYYMYKKKQEANEVTTELVDKLWDQADSLENLVDEYDKLQLKSKLTTDEFGRMIDIQKDLQVVQDPGKIADLEKEYKELAKKSGLTNDELDKMIGLNKDIIEQAPNVEKSFSEKGHAIVESTDAVKDYIQSLRDMAWIELEAERVKALEREQELLNENKEIEKEIAELESKITELIELRQIPLEEVDARLEEIQRKMDTGLLTQEEFLELEHEQDLLLQLQSGKLIEALEAMQEQRAELIKKQELNEDELAKLEEINVRMAELLLAEVDINWEKGKGLDKLDDRIKKLKDERKELVENAKKEGVSLDIIQDQLNELDKKIGKHEAIRDQIDDELGYQSEQTRKLDEQNKKTDEQIRKLERTKGIYIDNQGNIKAINAEQDKTNEKIGQGVSKAYDLHRELSKDASKDVKVSDKGTVADIDKRAAMSKSKEVKLYSSGLATINREASSPVTKVINFVGRGLSKLKFWEKGTPPSGHPGGPAVIGERGSELTILPSGRAFLSPNTHTLLDLPRGTHVIPHHETKRIVRNAPRYADGTRDWSSALGNSAMAQLFAVNRGISESETLVTGSGGPSNDNRLINLLIEQNEYLKKSNDLLTALLGKDLDLYKLNRKVDAGLSDISDRRNAALGIK